MYSVGKNQLVRNLCKLAAHHCSYTKQPCDCKFITEDGDVGQLTKTGSGCPELTVAAMIISQMSALQFAELAKSADINIHEDSVSVIETIKEFQEKRNIKNMRAGTTQTIDLEVTTKVPVGSFRKGSL